MRHDSEVQYGDIKTCRQSNQRREQNTTMKPGNTWQLTHSDIHTANVRCKNEHACPMCRCLLNIQIVIPLCVFQLHVWGAHGQGHDGKSATNVREL